MTDTKQQTVYSKDKRILFYEINHFVKDIIMDNHCFVCGAAPGSKEFNNEHVVPNWILKKFDLTNNKIILPNFTKIKYSKYTVPCCKECNTELGEHFEVPISKLLSLPYQEIIQKLEESYEAKDLLYRWLCLIYFKTHLKDNQLALNQDKRKRQGKIGDIYNYQDFQHVHCIVRSHHTGAVLNSKVYGSMFINRIVDENNTGRFDYIDNPWTSGVLIQIGNIGIASILDDSFCSINYIKPTLDKIKGPTNIFQFFEVFAHLNFTRYHLKEKPIFQSSINSKTGYNIICTRPNSIELKEPEDESFTHGRYLKVYSERLIGDIKDREKFITMIEEGKWTFLFDEDCQFINVEERMKKNDNK